MTLTDYLAKNYLNADAPDKKSKKRKRKEVAPPTGVLIADDTEDWKTPKNLEDEDGPTLGRCIEPFAEDHTNNH